MKVKETPKKFISNYDENFKKFISDKIFSSGKTYLEIEDLSGKMIKKSTIMQLAYGAHMPSARTLAVLAEIFNFSVDKYFGIANS